MSKRGPEQMVMSKMSNVYHRDADKQEPNFEFGRVRMTRAFAKTLEKSKLEKERKQRIEEAARMKGHQVYKIDRIIAPHSQQPTPLNSTQGLIIQNLSF
jgi:hypothetical protein